MKRLIAPVLAVLFLLGIAYWAGTLRSGGSESPGGPALDSTARAGEGYYCSMHPAIRLPGPGLCPICKMDLIPIPRGGLDAGPRALELGEAATRLAEIATAPVERRRVEKTLALFGKIAFDETQLRTITAWVDGRLDRLYVNYTGVPVETGDHLAEIYSPQLYAAQQQLLEALKSSTRTPDAGSEFLRRSADATLEAVRTKLELLGLSAEQIAEIETRDAPSQHLVITSPVKGVVVEKLANEGDYVHTGSPIYRVANLDRLWVQLDAYESDLPWIRYGQAVEFATDAYPGEWFHGAVTFIGWVVREKTRTVGVRLHVENDDARLKPGMFVRARVRSPLSGGGRVMAPELAGKWISPMHPEIVKDTPGACDICGMALVPAESLFELDASPDAPPLVIPASAPLITGRRAVVYVKRPDASIYEGREVLLGPRAGELYVVLGGLEEGELVVTRGAFKIDSSLEIRAKPSLMNPAGGAAADE